MTFQDQIDNRNMSHLAFNFITNNKEYLLNFMLKLVNTNNKATEFVDGEKKFPILDFTIEFLT